MRVKERTHVATREMGVSCGKLEVNELPEDALMREIKEELNVEIKIIEALPIAEHAYVPEKIIQLIPYRCVFVGNETPRAAEHSELRWVKKDELLLLDWAAADVPIVLNYIQIP